MKLFSLIFGFLLIAALSGCGSLTTLPPKDDLYFRQKVETALGDGKCLRSLMLLNQNHERTVMITLAITTADEERDSLKVIAAMSHDPLVPQVDDVCIVVHQTRALSLARRMGDAAFKGMMQGLVQGLTGATLPPGSAAMEEEISEYSCVIKREALLKGEPPTVVIKDGYFVSGPYQGQSTDALWLKENKVNLPKPDVPPAKVPPADPDQPK